MTTAVASETAGQVALLGWARALLAATFIVALPLLVISTNVRVLVTDRDFILAGFRENRVGEVTGLDQRQLERVAEAFPAYFQAPPGRMDVQVELGGQQRQLFNEKELMHMEEVQGLVQLFFRLQVVAAILVAARVAYALLVERSPRMIGQEIAWSTGLVVAIVLLVGVFALVDFELLWLLFHRVAFRGELWMLDPRTDYLIMLFPEPFWYAGTLRLATATALTTLAVAVAGVVAWRLGPPVRT